MLLTTNRLLLREFEFDDWPAVLAYQSDPRYLRYYHWAHRSEEDVRDFVRMFLDAGREVPRTGFQLAIVLRENNRLIGNCGFRLPAPEAQQGEIGYEIDPRYWGHGYATEAARAMLAFGFGDCKVHRISANCVAENTGSARVLEKLGMQREGRLRENEWIKGRWHDTL
ncbi:MAG: GNAT family N-acetyltransferase, partial [Chloroflexi bacterium]|nr:GNAT family N-acetyltransferase [Chloroflexota bacterium]